MPVTFQVVGNLADFGDDVRAGVKVRATATPGVKVGDVAVHSNQPETVVTDETGAFTLELVSLPGVWYRIQTPYANAINTVNLAGYVPDVDDPTTGEAFPADTVIDLIDVVDEDPTPGYDVLAYTLDSGGGGGVTVHSGLTGRTAADSHPTSAITGLDAALAAAATDADLAAHAADTTAVHGIADTSALVVTTDPRLSDDRDPTAHTHPVGDLEATGTANSTTFLRGDNTWATPAGGGGGAVDSVNGETGVVVLSAADVGAAPALGSDDNYATDAEKVKLSNLSGTNTGDQTLPTWSTISGKPAVIAEGATQADARTAIGAGTSSIVVGTGAGDAKAGNYQPTAANISDSTATGRAVLTAADAAAARTALSLGTAATTASTAYATAAQGALADSALQAATAQAINAQTGTSYTLVSGDAGKVVTLSNAGAITLNAPGSVFTAGQQVDVIVIGAGMATVVGTSGATANGTPSLVSRAQYSAFTVKWLSATSAIVIGDLA